MPTLSALWDIKSLIEHHASIQYANKGRPSTSNGVQEWHSNCPFCGGTDRFIMRPELGDYSCAIRSSGCGRHGDCIDFLKEYCSMSHAEACEILQIEHNADFVPSSPPETRYTGSEQPPNARWIETGFLLVERAQAALWNTSEGRVMLDYLHGRGLGNDIIKKKKIGFIPLRSDGYFYEDTLENWGLDPDKEVKKSVKVANGILIPWFEGSTLWRLGIKRPSETQSYGQVLGSGEGLFNVGEIQYDFPAMIVEGEICAMSVEQEAGDLIACVATGSTTRGRLNKWIAELGLPVAEKNGFVLQSFDEDDSGDVGSEYWIQNLKRCIRWSPLVAKDPNDILRGKFLPDTEERHYSGYTLREWVEAGIHIAKVEFGLSRPFVLPPQVGGIESVPTIPLARGKTLDELVQERRKEKGLPPISIPPWSQKDLVDLEKAFSKVQIVGPDVDMKALAIREYEKYHLAPDICLNKDCPCQEVWGDVVLKRTFKKK